MDENKKSDQVEVLFLVNKKSKDKSYENLMYGLSSGCSAADGAIVPEISLSEVQETPPW